MATKWKYRNPIRTGFQILILALIGYRILKRGIPPLPTESIESIKRDLRAIKGIGKRGHP